MNETVLSFESGAASDTGLVRKVNEDSFLANPASGLWAVSDGMGGHEGGRVASSMVVDALQSVPPHVTAAALLGDCERRLSAVNHHLRRIAADRGWALCGATVVVLLVHGGKYACLWSGDSRIYRVRGGVAELLTRDHSEAEDLVRSGIMTRDEVKHWPRRNVITRAVGVTEALEVDIVDGAIEPGDAYVLCSDGLTNHVDDAEIAEVVTGFEPQTACDSLVGLTLERGAKDNVTVIVARARTAP